MWTQTAEKKEKTLSNVAPTSSEKANSTQNTTRRSVLTSSIIPKHSVLIHPHQYKSQPKGYEMGKITNDLKELYSEYTPVTKILDYFGKGHNIILSDAQTDKNNRLQFVSSSIFAIDIDDEDKITDPIKIISDFQDQAAGMFFTFSHGKEGKGNRYRLLFQLDDVINSEFKMKSIIELIANDLKTKGLPVDTQAKNPLQVVRGGKKYILFDAQNKLNTKELLERVKIVNQQRQRDIYNEFEKELRPVPFEELKNMAESVGHIPTGTGQGELWKRLVIGIKHYANSGYISQDEGYELFDIISGGEQSHRSWETLRSNGQATIKSLIYEAKQRGYQGKYTYYANENVEETFDKEVIKVKDHIPTEVAKDILNNKSRILVDSPTGSGKTTAFLNAFKELSSNQKHFYIFAMPTIALTLQNAYKHKVKAIKGQTKDLFKMIYKAVKNGDRTFISTYDMVPSLVDFLRTIEPGMIFTLVVDEFHKFVIDYDINYRHEAISNLYDISQNARTFIGLSGTIDDINKNEFDKVIKIDNNKPASPCQEFAVYTYQKRKNALSELAQLIETWTKQRNLLIYIQSKKKIEQLKYILQRKNIKVRTISANSKRNSTYKQLVENETVDEDVQVILTTSVIADGVNIQNDVNWEVITVCNDFSNLFNYSSIKQISNRLRNDYRRFSIFMQEPRNEKKEPFYIESAYKWRMKIAENVVNEINQHPYFDLKLFRKSLIEKRYGIYAGFEGLKVDRLFLRHAVSKEQERYYSSFRYAFVNAVERALHTKLVGILDITEEIKNNRLDLTETKNVIETLEDHAHKSDDEKAKNIQSIFTKEVYEAFKVDNDEIKRSFKMASIPIHYACISKLSGIADYNTCKKVVCSIKRKADTHAFYNDIKNLVDIMYFHAVNRASKTKSIVNKLLELNEFMTNDEYKKAIEKIAKKARVSPKDIKAVEKMVVFESEREGKQRTRIKRVSGTISLDYISSKHKISKQKVGEVIKNYAHTQSKTIKIIVENKLETLNSSEKQLNLV